MSLAHAPSQLTGYRACPFPVLVSTISPDTDRLSVMVILMLLCAVRSSQRNGQVLIKERSDLSV